MDDLSAVKSECGGADAVLAVLVIYGQKASQSHAWKYVLHSLQSFSATQQDGVNNACVKVDAHPSLRLVHLLVYDNTHESQWEEVFSRQKNISYHHDKNNGGTAAAYLAAFSLANNFNCEWVLLLDQDTVLPNDYLVKARVAASRNDAPLVDEVGLMLTPWILHGQKVISPSRFGMLGGSSPLSLGSGDHDQNGISCIASGGLLNRAARAVIFDFPDDLWLDYVDHWMVARLRKSGGKVRVISAQLAHNLSVETPDSLGERRIRSILAAERCFLLELSWLARCVYPVRLLIRALKYALAGSSCWHLVLAAIVAKRCLHSRN